MTSSFMGFGVLLIMLPVLIGQWIGILGLGKGTRDSAWWCMMVGICCSTLGTIGTTLFVGLMMTGGPMQYGGIAAIAARGLSGLGSLLFTIGFAIHGQQASKTGQRIAELEAIAAAQGEELNRLRATY